jgi:rod shape determining protein RodA
LCALYGINNTSSIDSLLSSTFYKQIIWIFLGAIAFILTQYIRFQFLYDYSYVFYLFLFILIFSTMFFPKIEGARRWIPLGPFYFQPSELGKIIYVFGIARLFSDIKKKNELSYFFFIIIILSLIPPILVFIQPDLGTAMIYFSIIIPMLFWSNFNVKIIIFLIAPLISMIAVSNLFFYYMWMIFLIIFIILINDKIYYKVINFILNLSASIISPYIWFEILKPHQRQRIETFIDPFSDPLGKGYQVIQSIITIGSGGLWGKGLGNGTQTQLRFLPVRDTDFIISVVSEEMGFMTIFFLLLVLCWLVYWVLDFAQRVENEYISTVMIGLLSIIFMHIIINFGMISGLLPVTGLPVPFISYGGSFFLTCSIIVGLINNIINNHI